MLLRELGKAWHLALSVPKSLVFNLRYFPFGQAIRLPVLLSCRIKLVKMGGSVTLASCRFGSVRLGFQGSDAFPAGGTQGTWCLFDAGRVHFGDKINFGPALRIHCSGLLEFGDSINGNAGTSIFCAKRIGIGSGGLVAWNVTLMDHDFHVVTKDGQPINAPEEIDLGGAVWIGANATILKGTRIARGSVVGACAVVRGEHDEENCVIAGNPAQVIRRGVSWQHS